MDLLIERRTLPSEVQTDGAGIHGFAAVYDRWSDDLGGFIEKIRPGAFDAVLSRRTDVAGLLNHNPYQELGRVSLRTLRLDDDRAGGGLHYENDLPDSELGRYVRSEVQARRLAGSSFAFTVNPRGGDRWEHDTHPKRREILEVRDLFDVGPVWSPAYPQTSVAMRMLTGRSARKLCERCGQARAVWAKTAPGGGTLFVCDPCVNYLAGKTSVAPPALRLRRQRLAEFRWRFPSLPCG